MDPRFIFAALTLAFSISLVFATLTTVRQVNAHVSSVRHHSQLGFFGTVGKRKTPACGAACQRTREALAYSGEQSGSACSSG
jgi:hypothetical protein